jgi:hypothetical protein
LNRSQKFHITDIESTPILSTNPDSAPLTSLSQALVTSNSAIEHLGLGRIKGVHAHYGNGDVVQTAKLEGKTGVVATVTGKSVRRSTEVQKIVDVVHGALEGNEEREQGQPDGVDGNDEERSKNTERSAHWEVLGSG